MAASTIAEQGSATRRKLVRRQLRDRSQTVRRWVQGLFLLLNVGIGFQFYAFVRACEKGIVSQFSRPSGIEGWLPIASLMNLKFFLTVGRLPNVLCAGMLLLSCFLVISFLLRKAFCSWLCPIGTLSEGLWKLGRKLLGRNLESPRWMDVVLRSLKYLLMGFFLFAVVMMSAEAIEQFLSGPYGAVADVRMLNFFRHLSGTATAVLLVLAALSVLIKNFWCRYLCPYGALMGLVALVSPARIRREAEPCIDCGKCSKACPSRLPVDQLVTIRSAECTACLECVAVCPAEGALHFTAPRKIVLSPWMVAAAITLLFLATVLFGRITKHWNPQIPLPAYVEFVQHADEVSHP